MPKRIVITGGPGTGKTSVIKNLEEKGFYCFHEVVRSFTLEAKKNGNPEHMVSNPLAFVEDPFLFNQRILDERLLHFKKGQAMAEKVVFYDRGIPDVLAYMRYFQQPYGQDFALLCQEYRYDLVIVLPPWEAIYRTDEERLESFQEASEIHEQLLQTYAEFQYNAIKVPKGTIDERTTFVMNLLDAYH